MKVVIFNIKKLERDVKENMNNGESKLALDLLHTETYEEGVLRIVKENVNVCDISYDKTKDEFILKDFDTIKIFEGPIIYENDFFTGGPFETEANSGKLTCAIDSQVILSYDDIISKCEQHYNIFSYFKEDLVAYKLWGDTDFYEICRFLSRIGDFMVFTLQKHIIFVMLEIGYEKIEQKEMYKEKLHEISTVLNLNVKKLLCRDSKYQGLYLNYGTIDKIEKHFIFGEY